MRWKFADLTGWLGQATVPVTLSSGCPRLPAYPGESPPVASSEMNP